MLSRRRALGAGAAVAGVGVAAVAGWQVAPGSVRRSLRGAAGLLPEPYIPDVPEGQVQVESVVSRHMGDLDLFTAVPDEYGDGAGLPVVVVMHGASATAAQLREFGLGRFVTAAVQAGAPPFVLVGTDDGPAGWEQAPGSDPVAMLREELPEWLDERGFAFGSRAVWGWSRGGYGALRLVQREPSYARALALFSPALHDDSAALSKLEVLGRLPWGLWCGTDDPFADGAAALAEQAPRPPDPWVQGTGGHTRVYWNQHTVEMLSFLAGHLGGRSEPATT